MLLLHGCHIALIDGATFELYRNAGSAAEPELLWLDPPELDSGDHADPKVGEDAHARAAALWINAQALGGRIKDLVILAPPRTLGELRKHYHSRTRHVLRHELATELAGFHPEAILAALRNTT